MPIRPRIDVATVFASAAVAPGTMTARQASYDALSIVWRTIVILENSMAANPKRINNGSTNENSTVADPVRRTEQCLECVMGIINMKKSRRDQWRAIIS